MIRLAPADLRFSEIPIGDLPLYSPDYDANFPPEANALKGAISAADAILFVSPEYNRSIPGALKNAIDWASRPWGQNSFEEGEVTNESTREFLTNYMSEFRTYITRVLTVIPRP